MTVTACLVTRNHDQSLERALLSVNGLATEAIVADTGSTDGTIALAERRGARILPIAWANDFSAASNAAIDAATGDWILILNPDEEVDVPRGVEALAAIAARKETFAALVRVQDQLAPDHPGTGTAAWEARLFRRDPAVRYRGRLHPWFETPLEGIAAGRGQIVVPSEATIHRHAYLSRPTPDKLRWVTGLLEAELRDRPGKLHYLIELGRNLLWLNDPRGHEVLAEAAEQVRQASSAPMPPSPTVGSLLEYLLSVSTEQTRSCISRDEAREIAGRWFPNTPPVVWAVAAERFAAGDYSTAAGLLEHLIEMGRIGRYDTSGGRFDPAIIGPSARSNLGTCYLHLGRWDDARARFASLLTDPRFRDAAARGFALAERQQRP